MKQLFLLVIVVQFANTGFTQQKPTAEDSIKQTINTFFKGMQTKDTALIRTLLTSTIFMQSVSMDKKGETIIQTDKIESWFNQITTLPPSIKTIEERITFDKILVDEAMAMAWTPFELYLNNKFYSCGVNHFQLVRMNGAWKVNYIIDTRRKSCKTSPTPPKEGL